LSEQLSVDTLKRALDSMPSGAIVKQPEYVIVPENMFVDALFVLGDKKAVELHDFLVAMAKIGVQNITAERGELMPDNYANDIKLKLKTGERTTLGSVSLGRLRMLVRHGLNVQGYGEVGQVLLRQTAKKNEPWENCANICMPLIQSHVDAYKSRVIDTMFGTKPVALVSPPAEFEANEQVKEDCQRRREPASDHDRPAYADGGGHARRYRALCHA